MQWSNETFSGLHLSNFRPFSGPFSTGMEIHNFMETSFLDFSALTGTL